MYSEKKVGIMSMQRVVNYGSFLQAHSLKNIIQSLGYVNVEFIDYEFERELTKFSNDLSIFRRILKHKNVITFLRMKQHQIQFKKLYAKYLEDLNIKEKKYTKDVDTLVIGSDEVFNCIQAFPVGYSRGLFGKGYEKSNVISYAGSFGHTKLNGLKEYKIDKEIGEMFNRFKAISVRDENSKNIVKALLPKKQVLTHLDPVLVGDFNDVTNRPVKYDNYIIVYAYTGRLTRIEEKAIRTFAKKHHKKIISLGFYQKCADINLIVHPLDVLSYFKNADFVITDTFHGTVFSIKTNARFCTIVRDSNRNKLTSLLKTFGLESQKVDRIDDIERIYKNEIDFKKCNKKLAEEIVRSRKYLAEGLK